MGRSGIPHAAHRALFSITAWHVGFGPCTGIQGQDTAPVPTIYSKQVPEGQDGHLDPRALGYAEQRPKLLALQERQSCHLRMTPWCALVGEVGE